MSGFRLPSFLAVMIALVGTSLFVAPAQAERSSRAAASFDFVDDTAAAGATTYFSTFGSSDGSRLWRTDGTVAGTAQVPGVGCDDYGCIPGLTAVGDRVFFLVVDHGSTLWVSDGSDSGTHPVPAPGGGTFTGVAGLAGGPDRAWFFVPHGAGTYELWTTDGTDATDVATVPANCCGAQPSALTVADGLAWFVAPDQSTWRSDGTAAGTFAVTDVGVRATDLRAVGSGVVFADAVAAPYHHDDVTLWRSDGTPGGTTQVAGTVYERSPYAGDLGAEPDRYVFVAGRGNPEIPRLWQTDGTAAGTRTVTDQNLARFPDVREVETAGAATWFVARTPQLRYEVFHKSGAAVSQVTRIEQSRRPDVHQISAVGSRLMFFLERDGVDQLWVTDHSTRGAHRVGSDSWTRHSVRPANTSGGTLVFVGQRGAQSGMWRSDGTAAGTFALIKGRAVADRSVARRTAAAGSTTDARPLVASATASPRAADNRSAPADRTCAGRSATIVATGGKVRGTSGPDVIVVNISDTAGGTTEVSAGAGKDVVCIAFEAPDPEENVIGRSTVHGGKGDDQIFGSDGWDDLSGDQGNDYLYGGAANDTFDGGRGSDVLDGSFGYYFEGRNNDQAVVTGVGHVDLDLDRGFVHTARGTDLITGISNVVTGSGDDVVRGDADANRLLGGAGNDQLLGRGGDDVLDGQAGRDRVVGGAGHDVCRGEKRASCEKR